MIVYVLVNKAGILFSPFLTLSVLSLLSRSRDLGNLGGRGCCCHLNYFLPSSSVGFPHGSVVKNLPAKEAMRVRRFGPWVKKIPWRGKGQPSPVFLPGKSHGQRSLAGYSPWGSITIRHDWAVQQQEALLEPLSLTCEPLCILGLLLWTRICSDLLGWPKSPFGFSYCCMGNPNEVFGQPNTFSRKTYSAP